MALCGPGSNRLIITLLICAVLLAFAVYSSIDSWRSYNNLDSRWGDGKCTITATDVVEGERKACNPESNRILLLNVSLEEKRLRDQKAYDSDKQQDCFRTEEAGNLEKDYEKELNESRACWFRQEKENATIVVLALGESNEYSEERIRAIWITGLAGVIGLVVIFILFKILTQMRERKNQPHIIQDIRNETGPGPTNPSHSQGGVEGPVYI